MTHHLTVAGKLRLGDTFLYKNKLYRASKFTDVFTVKGTAVKPGVGDAPGVTVKIAKTKKAKI